MFDPPVTLLDTPSLLAVSAPADHDGSVGVSAYLPVGRCVEPASARGAADVLAVMLRPGGGIDVTADDFTLTWSIRETPGEVAGAVARMVARLRQVLAFDAARCAGWFEQAREQALAATRARARSRPWIAEAVLRQWTYHDDPYFSQSVTERVVALPKLTPQAFEMFLHEVAFTRRMFVAVCGKSTVDVGGLACWPGIGRARLNGPKPAAGYVERSFGREADDTPTSYVCVSLPCVPRDDPLYRVVALCALMLGAGDGPLMRLLRHERGHLYRVEARAVARLGSGDLVVKAEVASGTAQSCVDAIRAELRSDRVSSGLLEAVKGRLLARIGHAVSTNAGRAADVVSSHFYGLPPDHHRSISSGVRAITPEVVREVARSLASTDVCSVII